MQHHTRWSKGPCMAALLAGMALAIQLALVALVAPAGAVIARTGGGRVVSYQPTIPRLASALARARLSRGVSAPVTSRAGAYKACESAELACLGYYLGPVMRTTEVTPVFWNPTGLNLRYPTGYEAEVDQFSTDLAADSGKEGNFFSILTQYFDTVEGSPHSVAYSVTAGTPVKDADPLPVAAGDLCLKPPYVGRPCVTDAGLRAELDGLIANHGLARGLGHEYVVFFPDGIDSCLAAEGEGSEACSGKVYCGYHTTLKAATSEEIQYANEPENGDPEYGLSCTAVEGITPAAKTLDTASHEISESVTDPEVESNLSWYDRHTFEIKAEIFEYGEVGDICAWEFKQGDPAISATFPADVGPEHFNQTINGHRYLLQTEWDNAHSTCSLSEEAASTKAVFSDGSGAPAQTGEQISFDGLASHAPVPITNYKWEWGDGTEASGPSSTASHAYDTSHGLRVVKYQVTLTVTDQNGNTGSSSKLVEVQDRPPSAAFTAPSGSVAGTATAFDGSASSDPDGTVASYSWSFGDGSPAQPGAAASHAYAAPGQYTATLTVTDDAGLSTSVSHTVTVADAPPTASPALASAAPRAGIPASFDGSSSKDADGSIAGYSWGFGDGSPAQSGAKPSHTYAAPGQYTVTLTVTDNGGLTASASTVVTVAVPSNTLSFGPVKHNRDGSIDVTVIVPGPGVLSARDGSAGVLARFAAALGLTGAEQAGWSTSGLAVVAHPAGSKGHKRAKRHPALVAPASVSVSGAGNISIHLAPTARGKRQLSPKHKLAVAVTFTFAPTDGTPASVRRSYRMSVASPKSKRGH